MNQKYVIHISGATKQRRINHWRIIVSATSQGAAIAAALRRIPGLQEVRECTAIISNIQG